MFYQVLKNLTKRAPKIEGLRIHIFSSFVVFLFEKITSPKQLHSLLQTFFCSTSSYTFASSFALLKKSSLSLSDFYVVDSSLERASELLFKSFTISFFLSLGRTWTLWLMLENVAGPASAEKCNTTVVRLCHLKV